MTRDDALPVRSLAFDSEEGAYVSEFDNSDVSLDTIIISVIAQITGQSATDLQPLHDVVDPDALNRLIKDRPSGLDHSKRQVEFTYQDLKIRILGSGVIKVYPSSTRKGGETDE
jgi:hypothetical protein